MAVEHLLRRAGVRKSYLPEGAHIKHDLQQIYLLVEANNHGISDLADQLESLQNQINQNRGIDTNLLSRVDAAITSIGSTTTNLLTELSRLEGSVKGIREDTHPGTPQPVVPGLMFPGQNFFSSGQTFEGIANILAKVEILTAAVGNLRASLDSSQRDVNTATSNQLTGLKESVARTMSEIKTYVDDIKVKYHELSETMAKFNRDLAGLTDIVSMIAGIKVVVREVLKDKGYKADASDKRDLWDRIVNSVAKKGLDIIISAIATLILTAIANAYLKSTSDKIKPNQDIIEKLGRELETLRGELQVMKQKNEHTSSTNGSNSNNDQNSQKK